MLQEMRRNSVLDILLCLPDLLAYGLALFSEFACLWFGFVFQICSASLANLEKAWFSLDRIE